MDELKDDDIADIQDAILDDDIIQSTDTGILQRLLSGISPSQETQQLGADALQTGQDFAVGAAQGMTLGGLDELGGALGAGVERGLGALGIGPAAVDSQLAAQGFQGVQEPLAETYRGYQQGVQGATDAAAASSPIANTLGQIGGGIAGGTALGGALGIGGSAGLSNVASNPGMASAAMNLLRSAPTALAKAAPGIALEAGLSSRENLIGQDANPMGVAADAAGGLAFGVPAMAAMMGIQGVAVPKVGQMVDKVSGKVADLVESSPLARQAKIAFERYGKELKVNPKNEKAVKEGIEGIEDGTPFSLLDRNRASGIADDVLTVDRSLGANVGSSLEEATNAGTKIDAQDIIQDTMSQIVQLAQEMPSLTKDANFNNVITKILSRNYTAASPRDIKNAMDEITNSIERIGSYKYATPELEEAANFLRPLRRNLDQRLKDQVPSYRDAAERFSQYRQSYIEQPIAGGGNPAQDDIYYGSMKKGEKKLVDAYEDLVKRSTMDSQSAESTEARYSRLLQQAKKFQDSEVKRVADGKIKAPATKDPGEFMRKIRDFSDDASVRRSTRTSQESQAGGEIALKNAIGIGNTGRGALLTGSYLAGRAVSAPMTQRVTDLSRRIYRAPAQSLSNLASKLESTDGFGAVGRALREGLENGDSAKRNAALFTIMQNPNSRAFISAEDFPSEEDENVE